MLPKDPYILLSTVNMKLRGEYDSLEELCASLDIDKAEPIEKLSSIGYKYDQSTNQFK